DAGTPWDSGRDDFPPLPFAEQRLPLPALLMGDFNLRPSGPEYAAICGAMAGKYGRAAAHDQFADAWILAGNDAQSGASIMPPNPPGDRLDPCFVGWPLADAVRRAWIDEGAAGSDHYPLFVELEL